MSAAVLLYVVPGTIICSKCKQYKPLDAFAVNNSMHAKNRSQRAWECKDCFRARQPSYEKLPDDHPDIANAWRICCTCEINKPLTAYSFDSRVALGRGRRCRQCTNDIRNAKKGPSKRIPIEPTRRDYRRRRYRGITSVAFKALFDAQDGRCGICGTQLEFLDKFTCLDHDHMTGDVRGVLCSRCNLGIGHMNDDLEVLRGAVRYLEKYQEP